MLRFCEELTAASSEPARAAPKLLRADSKFCNTKIFECLEKIG